MTGPEVSLLAITDGRAVARFPAARDYKPIGEGNTGPNTGGMGSVSPVPDIPDALADELRRRGPPAGDRRDGAPRDAVLGRALRGADDDRRRPAGARVQHALRRPRDPGPAAAPGRRTRWRC